MTNFFEKGKAIYAKGRSGERNGSFFFQSQVDGEDLSLTIAANSFYRVYLNGKFFAYGPSRDAHFRSRVDRYLIPGRGKRVITIEVSGYNCCSFYSLDTPPFLCYEVKKGDEVIDFSSESTKVFVNETRLRKVTRFSYQRAFSESYRIDKRFPRFLKGLEEPYEKVDAEFVKEPIYEERIADYPAYPSLPFSPIESGEAFLNPDKPIYQDRYQVLDFLKIFPMEEWEIDSNRIASQLDFEKTGNGGSGLLGKGKFLTYRLPHSYTGFFDLKIKVEEDCFLVLLFDEVDIKNPDHPDMVGISFYRNTTHNCITYELKKGSYRLISFEPYTALFARMALLKGKAKISSFRFLRYENPDCGKFSHAFLDPRIDAVLNSAVSTFAQNAVDLLTDCPSRERAGWLCDSFFSGQAEPLITGKNRVEEAFLDNYAKFKEPNIPTGMVPMCYPADFPSKEFIPNWSLWYILELANYKARNGDGPLLKQSEKNIRGVLSYFSSFENELGLLENLEGWIFVEWSKANDADFISGVNFPSNMLYAEALEKAGYLLNEPALSEKGNKLKKLIAKMSFNGEFFVDNALRDSSHSLTLTDHTTETCQYYALFFGIVSPEENPAFFHKMVENFGEKRDDAKVYPKVYRSNVLMGIMMRLTILNRFGEKKRIFQEALDYFYKMALQTGTLWEHDSPAASLNHCFTSYLVNILLQSNFGLREILLKDKTILMEKDAVLEEGEVSIPLPGGKLILKAKAGKLSMRKPKGYLVQWN